MAKEETNDRGTLESDKAQENYELAFDEAQGIGASSPPQDSKTEAEGNQDLVNSISPEVTPESKTTEKKDELPPSGQEQGENKSPAPDTQKQDETAEQRYRTLQGILKKEKETWEQKEREYQEKMAKLESGKQPEGASSKDAKPAPTDNFLDGLSDEDKAALKEYDEEFDTVSKMEGLKRKAELNQIRKEFQEKLDALTQAITPAITVGNEVSRNKHYDAIRAVHDDFETYRDDGTLKNWIDTQPAYLKPALENAYYKGTAEDVIDLITKFKKENNIGGGNPDPSFQKAPVNSPKKEEKKVALSVVTNRRGAVNLSQKSTDDFEGAFDEAMNK